MQQETAVNRTKTPASWNDINWCRNRRLVRNLRQRVYRASRQGVTGLLEPCAVKAASTVLRGGGDSDVTSLPDFLDLREETLAGEIYRLLEQG